MKENFITKIDIKESRNLKDYNVELSTENRKHLILTGKNGSGKTSLLLDLNQFLSNIDNGNFQHIQNQKNNIQNYERSLQRPNISQQDKVNLERGLQDTKNWFKRFGGTSIDFSNSEHIIFDKCQKGDFLLAFFDSKRQTNLQVPTGIKKINLKKKYSIQEKANTNFIQYIVNLKADRSFARDDNEMDVVNKIDDWFEQFRKRLQEIFDVDSLELKFDRRAYNFEIIINGYKPFNFNTLSDGYSAIISIVTELLLRMESHNVKSYDLEGIVLIDEIETHLHVDLQKKVLPFLTDFFPKIQFIISTHSPFVLNSIENTIIFDLEKKIVTTDLSGYSYDTLIESYFDSNKYSNELISKVNEFENLLNKKEKSEEEIQRYAFLKSYLNEIPKFISDELAVKLQQLKLKSIKGNK
ncbi:AAA family ATPase [Carboxylicivirga linearis]|uniref:AAA family ATPase n=1 Tax=Carboxylicivirga linearis TaxID=1628157 RepID=A0ABS5JZ83_9BACT|nr:AAA family ATPase [Carboxylicivirga linearis]MBS2100217.1 AAA family ATPase [Carboxylicivirga linearis]